jgi:acyl-CoA thioester hydrolase
VAEALRHPLRVRYAEVDAQGVVFNAHYLAWFDMNMTELWRAAFGSYQAALDRGIDMVVVTAELTYRSSARFDELVDLEVSVSVMGNTSLTTAHAVRRDGQLLVSGTLRHVIVDTRTMTKIPIPEWARAALAPYALGE